MGKSAATTASDSAAIARVNGLHKVGIRPTLGAYLSQVWTRRQFAWMLARSRVAARAEGDILGALWNFLRPVLTAGVYLLVFGTILKTGKGVPNFTAFLTIGVFAFTYTSTCVTSGAKAISGNLNIVRALHFPRAVLPLATVLDELINMGPVIVVMLATAIATGEPIRLAWLLLVPIILIQTMFNLGLAMIFSRLTSRVRDVSQVLPFATRLWLYLSGIFYSVEHRVRDNPQWPQWAKIAWEHNPGHVIITAYRGALMESVHITSTQWISMITWSLVIGVFGIIYFWRGEETYGRG